MVITDNHDRQQGNSMRDITRDNFNSSDSCNGDDDADNSINVDINTNIHNNKY